MIVEVSLITWVIGGFMSLIIGLIAFLFLREMRAIRTEFTLVREILASKLDGVQNELTDHKNDNKRHL